MTVIFIRIETLKTPERPGIAIAQALRYATPVIEAMMPLASGSVQHPLSRQTLVEWTVQESTDLMPVVDPKHPHALRDRHA